MMTKCYLVFDSTGIKRMTKTRPALNDDEYFILVTLNIPGSYFKEEVLKAVINLPEREIKNVDVIAKLKQDIKEIGHFARPEIKITFEHENNDKTIQENTRIK